MSETLTDHPEVNEPVEEEKGEITYGSVSEYLSAYEESPQFHEVLQQRQKALKVERPDLKVSQEDLIVGSRLSPLYNENLIAFFRAGNLLPKDLSAQNEKTQKAIGEYWNYIKAMPNHINIIRATAHSPDDEEMKLFQAEKTRERLHTLAGLAIVGEGIALKNGDKITCDEDNPDDENALSLLQYNLLGRTLVSIISEENGQDIADPKREERKMAATRQFLDSGRYSNGHWVGKGEN